MAHFIEYTDKPETKSSIDMTLYLLCSQICTKSKSITFADAKLPIQFPYE